MFGGVRLEVWFLRQKASNLKRGLDGSLRGLFVCCFL